MSIQQDFRVSKGIDVKENAKISGNTSISKILSVGGNATISNTTTTKDLIVNHNASIINDLSANNINISSIHSTKDASVGTTLTVVGHGEFVSDVGIGTNLDVLGKTTTNQLDVKSSTNIVGGVIVGGEVLAKSKLTVKKSFSVSENAIIGGTASISGNTSISGGLSVGGKSELHEVVVSGNLTVNGTTTFVNTEVLHIADNIVTLNSDLTPTSVPTKNAGVEINRGKESKVSIIWDETKKVWTSSNATGNVTEIHTGGIGSANVSVGTSVGEVISGVSLTYDKFGHVVGSNITKKDIFNWFDDRFAYGKVSVNGTFVNATELTDTLKLNVSDKLKAIPDNANKTITIKHDGVGSANVSTETISGEVISTVKQTFDKFGHALHLEVGTRDLTPYFDTRYLGFSEIKIDGKPEKVVSDRYNDILSLSANNGVVITPSASADNLKFSVNIANTSNVGVVQFLDSVANTSVSKFVPTMKSVKTTYDKAKSAYDDSITKVKTVTSSNTSQINITRTNNDVVVDLVDTGVVAGNYRVPVMSVDVSGRVTKIANGVIGAVGGGNNAVFWLNDTVIDHDYIVPLNQNAGTFGPVTINDDVKITIPDDSAWTIV